jgi:hypothetical protein
MSKSKKNFIEKTLKFLLKIKSITKIIEYFWEFV